MKKLIPFIYFSLFIFSFLALNCSSSDQSSQTKMPVGENIPPGSAVVLCKLNSFTESGDVYLIDVSIKSVLGYGSATDEIAPDANLKLQIAKKLIEINSLKKGTELQFEIRQPKISKEGGNNNLWTVSQLMK